MTLITGQVADVGMNNASGVFYARAAEFRGDGTTVVSPSPATFTITGGVVSAEVEPGPTIITLHVGPVRKDWFVNVPETDVGLGDLIATYMEYEPAVVSAAIKARDAAIEAESEAKQAAIDAEAKRVAAETAADLTGQDRLHVDNVRALLDEAYDQSQAGMALPPRLTETALNATYVPQEMVATGRLSVESLTNEFVTQADAPATFLPRSEADALLASTTLTVNHGADATAARPDHPGQVMWLGSVTPVNRLAGDIVYMVSDEPGPFSPALLDLVAWWDLSETPVGTITSIQDKGPRGHHLSTLGGTGSINVQTTPLALPSARFDGTAWLTTGPLAAGSWAHPTSVYMAVAVDDNTAAVQTLIDGTTASTRAMLYKGTPQRLGINQSVANAPSLGYLFTTAPVIVSGVFTGTDQTRGALNGSVVTGPTDVGAGVPTGLRVGGSFAGTYPLFGSIGEIVVARDVTVEQDQEIQAYLAQKWSI